MASSELPPRPKRPRYIAGAVCPNCGAVDKMVLTGEGLDAVRTCNQCGFEEKLKAVTSSDPEVSPIKLPE